MNSFLVFVVSSKQQHDDRKFPIIDVSLAGKVKHWAMLPVALLSLVLMKINNLINVYDTFMGQSRYIVVASTVQICM